MKLKASKTITVHDVTWTRSIVVYSPPSKPTGDKEVSTDRSNIAKLKDA
jgi:hypothetical protein